MKSNLPEPQQPEILTAAWMLSDARRLNALEDDRAKLKISRAEAMLDDATLNIKKWNEKTTGLDVWFVTARKAFETVLQQDPMCAIGYWGIAVDLLGNDHHLAIDRVRHHLRPRERGIARREVGIERALGQRV